MEYRRRIEGSSPFLGGYCPLEHRGEKGCDERSSFQPINSSSNCEELAERMRAIDCLMRVVGFEGGLSSLLAAAKEEIEQEKREYLMERCGITIRELEEISFANITAGRSFAANQRAVDIMNCLLILSGNAPLEELEAAAEELIESFAHLN